MNGLIMHCKSKLCVDVWVRSGLHTSVLRLRFLFIFFFGRRPVKNPETIFRDFSLIPAPAMGKYLIAWTQGNFGLYLLNSVFYTVAWWWASFSCFPGFLCLCAAGVPRKKFHFFPLNIQ